MFTVGAAYVCCVRYFLSVNLPSGMTNVEVSDAFFLQEFPDERVVDLPKTHMRTTYCRHSPWANVKLVWD